MSVCVCTSLHGVFVLSQREQKAEGKRGPDKTVPGMNAKETSARNFPVAIATAVEAACKNKHSSDFLSHSPEYSIWVFGHQYFVTSHLKNVNTFFSS